MKIARPALIEALEARIAPATFTVVNVNDAGAGSLRQALLNAEANNNEPIIDAINFNIPGFGPHTIVLNSVLPTINEAVSINGQTNPDFEGRPVIEIDGSLTSSVRGLLINAGNTTVRSLTINGFDLAGIGLAGAGGVTVQGCFIGTDYTGTVAQANGGDGINITSPDNIIGGDTAAERNVIAGNVMSGIKISGNGATGNIVQGNYIGTNLIGSLQVPNAQGVTITNGGDNTIGGTGAGDGNVISGNLVYDVYLSASSGNHIAGNIVGLDETAKLPLRSKGSGIYITGVANNNVIGGATVNSRNIISAHDEPGAMGVFIGGGSGNEVRGNIIGTNTLNDSDVGNVTGIRINFASNVTVADNVISANLGHGISASSVTNLQISINKIGTTVSGTVGLGNRGNGIAMDACAQVLINGNQISGNSLDGIQIFTSTDGAIQGNLLGTNNTGTLAIPNGLAGVAVLSCSNFLVGGEVLGQGNVISGNSDNGVFVYNNAAGQGVKVFGNRVGTDATGEIAIPNVHNGIYVNGGSEHQIGGAVSGQGNLVSGNGRGILVQGSGNFVRGNIVGLDKDGTTVLPNAGNAGGHGIQISAGTSNVIGGDGPGQGNVIAGNAGHGVFLQSGTGNILKGNIIGTNGVGAAGLGNMQRGVMHPGTASGTLIGGDTVGAKNVISGNLGAGVEVSGAANVTLRGNLIGLAPNGVTLVPNQGGVIITGTAANMLLDDNSISGNALFGAALDGVAQVVVQGNTFATNNGPGLRLLGGAHDNLIGGETAGAGNTFASNLGAGIAVVTGSGNRLSRNLFSGNSGLPIDLGNDGLTPNDALDADAGPNGLQNTLQIAGAALVGGSSLLAGTLQSAPNTSYRVEVFSGAGGAAQHFISATDVALDASGTASLQLNLGVTPAGEALSATVTNLSTGDTSEFSASTPFVPLLTISDVAVVETDAATVSAVFTLNLSTLPVLPVSFHFATQSGTATSGVDFTADSGNLAPNGLTATITVQVLADELAEAAEKFTVLLSNAMNVLILDPVGEGTIQNDDSTLFIDAKGKTATWRDLDGDLVTLKSSKGILSADDFVLLGDGNGGEQLAELLLSDDGPLASKASLKLTAKRTLLAPNSDGVAHLGFLDATGIDLGTVSISGDLGRVSAGDAVAKTAALGSLAIGSLGFHGLATQSPGGSLESQLNGNVGNVTLRGDLAGAHLAVNGKLGNVAIGGSIVGGDGDHAGSIVTSGKMGSLKVAGSIRAGDGAFSGFVSSGGMLGAVTIGGDLAGTSADHRAVVAAPGKITSLKVGGSVVFADVLAGFNSSLQAVNPDAAIGAVTVGDNWIASNLVAGVACGGDGAFGTNDDMCATAGAGYLNAAKVLSRIARIQVGGYVGGTEPNTSDAFGFTAQAIGALKIGKVATVLATKTLDHLALGKTKDTNLHEVSL